MKNKKKVLIDDAKILEETINETSDELEVIAIKKDSLMSIEVSGAYYMRVYNIMTDIINNREEADIPKFISDIVDYKDTETLTIEQATVQVFMSLIKTIETMAETDLEKYTETIKINKEGFQL